jgi:N-acyl-D-aspartate/D-glutamate deacylase
MRLLLLALIAMSPAVANLHAADPIVADVLLTGGLVVDGSGQPGIIGDVAIVGDAIAAVGKFEVASAKQTIDCDGRIVCPGFIDLHNHSDTQIISPEMRANMNYITQGCTTIITGNCGAGPVDVASYLDQIDLHRAGTNVGHLLPQGALREGVVGLEDRAPTPQELERMRSLADRAMRDGAWGMSTGLIYVPSSYARTEELVALAAIVGRHGGLYASHIRGEGGELLQSINEVLTIGRNAGLPVHVSHFKCSGRENWGLAQRAIDLIEAARTEGLHVTADQYPYIAASTSLEATVIPAWARAGGDQKLLERWSNQASGPGVIAEIEDRIRKADEGRSVRFARFGERPDWIGKSLAEVAEIEKQSPLHIVRFVVEHGGASIVHFSMNEEEVRAIMLKPWVATASDGRADLPGIDKPHPRLYGTFSRKIGKYAIAEQVLPLEAAIRSATGLPADIFGLSDARNYLSRGKARARGRPKSAGLARGYLRPGFAADVLVFDPQQFMETATFENPTSYSKGIERLWVNGVPVIVKGNATGALGGVALRHRPTDS